MNLSEKEALTLACVELRADLPLAQIAKETGLREHTVRYHLSNLEDRGVVRRVPFVNLVPAGYTYVGVFFSMAAEDQPHVSRLLQRLQDDPRVVWLAEMGGDFQYGMALCVRHVGEGKEFFDDLSKDLPRLFSEKSIAVQYYAVAFARKYLCSRRFVNSPLTIGSVGAPVVLDQTDQKILGGMSNLKHRSLRELARLLQMPLSTLDVRVKKLEERKILSGYVYAVDPALLGVQAHTLLLFARGVSRTFHQAVLEFAERHPAVTYLYRCLGSWDYELNIEVEQGAEVVAITRELSQLLGANISALKVLSKFRDIKFVHVPF